MYLMGIMCICCMHTCMGIGGMQHCSKGLVMLFVWMPLCMHVVKIVSDT